VVSELREMFDVQEAIRCSIYGKPNYVQASKVELYQAYTKKRDQQDHLDDDKPDFTSFKDDDIQVYFDIEKLITEFETIKQVLINNAIPVDIAEIESGGTEHGQARNTKGWGTRVLFDKKVFLDNLRELENMRKVLQVKKMFYIFNLPYDGKPKDLSDWHLKVQHRTT